jgi:hypothetical protein
MRNKTRNFEIRIEYRDTSLGVFTRRFLRKAHLYLGCVFASMLLFFTVSGFVQTFHFHKDEKDGSYQAPQIFKETADVHLHLGIGERGSNKPRLSLSFQYLVAIMSVGIAATLVLGVIMAFQATRNPAPVVLCLVAGTALPALFLLLGPYQ